MNTKEFMRLYKYIIYKIIIKFSIFTIITVPIYYSIVDNEQSNKLLITYPFSAYTSLLFFCVDTNIFIELPLMLLAINSFLVWSIPDNRTSVINFLDLTCIFWIIICYITCLNYTKTYNAIFKHRVRNENNKVFNHVVCDENNEVFNYVVCDENNKVFNHVVCDENNEVFNENNEVFNENNEVFNKNNIKPSIYIKGFFKRCLIMIRSDETLLNINNISSSDSESIIHNPFIEQNYTYFNYEYLLIPIDICITMYIIIVLNTSIKEQMINFINNNMNILVGTLILYGLLVVPTHYNNKYFIIGYLIMIIGLLLKILYLLNIMNIDFATGLFHICAVFSCQLFSIVINNQLVV